MSKKSHEEVFTCANARQYAKGRGMIVTHATVINWVRDHGLGYQIGEKDARWRPWAVYKSEFREFINERKKSSSKTSKKKK